MKQTTATGTPRERILQVASELFYQNGYRATGINEIIKKSGVAKATFYSNYPSKEILALAYVRTTSQHEIQATKEHLARLKTPYDKLIGLLEGLEPWAKETNYRGCGFINICSEIPDASNPVRKEGKLHYETIRVIVKDLLGDLNKERRGKWTDARINTLVDDYMLIFSGAAAMSELYHDPAPIRNAVEAAQRLLG